MLSVLLAHSHAARLLLTAARNVGTLRGLGDLPGHEFHGNQWTDVASIADVSLPKDTDTHEHFYHAFDRPSTANKVEAEGVKAGQAGKVWLSKDEIRDRGQGFAIVRVPKGQAKEGIDHVEPGFNPREFTVSHVPKDDVVRVIREVPYGTGGHSTREDQIAKYALSGVKLTEKEKQDLPEKYQRWFRSASRHPESAIHRAADAHVAKLSVAFRYAFAMGRKVLRASMKALGDLPGHEFHGNQWTDGFNSSQLTHKDKQLVLAYKQIPGSHADLQDARSRLVDVASKSTVTTPVTVYRAQPKSFGGKIKTDQATNFTLKKSFADGLAKSEDHWEVISLDLKKGDHALPISHVTDYRSHEAEVIVPPKFRSASSFLNTDACITAIRTALEDVLPPTLRKAVVAGGEAGLLMLRKRLRAAGDVVGHEFHGNQWTDAVDRLDKIPAVPEVVPGMPTGSIYTKDVFGAEVTKIKDIEKPLVPYDMFVAKEVKDQPKRIEHLDPTKLISTQDTLSRDKMRAFLKGEAKPKGNRDVIAVLHEGKYYVEDGNHRVAAAILRGDKSVTVRVIHSTGPRALRTAGDVVGHEFHGNQWTSNPMSGEASGVHTKEAAQRVVGYLERETGMKFEVHGSLGKGAASSPNDIDIAVVDPTRGMSAAERDAYEQEQSDLAHQAEGEIHDRLARGEITQDQAMQEMYGDAPHPLVKALDKIGFKPTKQMEFTGISVTRFKNDKTGHTIEVWDSSEDQGSAEDGPPIMRSRDLAFRTAKDTPKVALNIRFDATNQHVIDWADRHAAELIDNITETSREAINNAVAEHQETGDWDEYYDEILAAVGDEARADLIARHESMLAAGEGQRQGWDQAVGAGLLTGDEERVWIVTGDEKVCPICEGLEDKRAKLGEPYVGDDGEEYDGPPGHVQCRCTEGIA